VSDVWPFSFLSLQNVDSIKHNARPILIFFRQPSTQAGYYTFSLRGSKCNNPKVTAEGSDIHKSFLPDVKGFTFIPVANHSIQI
jgi:hypothetical protein